ncbi:MAG: outer membrane protein assembly factor BamD [Ignavibacteria bacterium]|nr:outer membrane protein assembly factor BamD [Ignavibacteria bacterium]
MHLPILVVIMFIVYGCSTSDEVKKSRTVDDTYAAAIEAFEDEDWLEAQTQFDIIKLQFPASQYADDAQYYLAEINFKRGEFILAAFNYSVIRRSFPTSEYARQSTFKVGACYEELALPADRDQEYTRKAVAAYTDFKAIYPMDSLAPVAGDKIHELRGRLAERYIIIAEHYERTNSRKSALVYYDAVISEYPDTKYYEQALVQKLRILYGTAMIDDARGVIALYRRTVKDPQLKAEVDNMERNLP